MMTNATPCRPLARRRHRQAFTLVELLVVIAILSVLLSLLMPALHKARESAKTTACLSNLKSIAFAELLYAQENGNMITPCDNSSTAFNAPNLTWAGTLVGYEVLKSPIIRLSYATHSAGSPVGMRTVLQCPNGLTDAFASSSPTSPYDPGNQRPTISAVYDSQGDGNKRGSSKLVDVWYGCNALSGNVMSNGFSIYPTWRYVPDSGTAALLPSLANIRIPSMTVAFYDGSANANYLKTYRISSRHNDNTQTNLVFWDGHAVTADESDMPNLKNSPNGTVAELNKLSKEYVWLMNQIPN